MAESEARSCPQRKKGTNPKVDAQFLTHGEVFLAAPIRVAQEKILI
jgi:hypothetical protein